MEACTQARQRFADLVGEPVPAVRIAVEPRAGYRTGTASGDAVVFWPTSATMADGARRALRSREDVAADTTGEGRRVAAHVSAQWREVLPHEIVHALMATRFYPDSDFPREGYGTPLPDWLEEGAAIWAEPRDSRRSRLATARDLPPARRDLRSILAGEHPAAADRRILTVRDGAPPPDQQALWDFYPQSIALVSFIHDEGGPEAVAELTRRLVRDPTDTLAIRALPGLPDRLETIEAAWRRWLDAAD
ncbi:MAG TPA: hypothetical protein VK966_04495 [Longimicrobiales bacterium]|nr:hypothetical protein [Longimicrobiales bacterium]